MTDFLTEQEQVEQLKKWLKVYGIPALLGTLAGIIIFYGWNYYQSYHTRILTHASKIYDEMLTDRAQNNSKDAQAHAEKLFSHFSQTPYGEIAALMLSRDAINKKDYAQAYTKLSWVLNHSQNPPIRQVARLRLARLFIAQQKPADAIQELKKVDDTNFNGLIDEVLGDAYLAMQKTTEARNAYQHALEELPRSEEIRPLLEMKLDNLANAG